MPAATPAPADVEWLDTVGSTNAEALARSTAGAQGPLWIAARRQTGGRGRSGRHWDSPEGNLYASLLLTFPRPLPTVPQLSLVAGLAVHDMACSLAPQRDFRLKWPNDVLQDGAKLAGILIEGRSAAVDAHTVVVGIGVNLAHHPVLPERPATSLAALGFTTTPEQALTVLAARFSHWFALWAQGDGFAAIRQAWLGCALADGTPVTVNTGTERLSGFYRGLEADGAMRLGLADGTQRRITFGDVALDAPKGAAT